MSRLRSVPEPSIIRHGVRGNVAASPEENRAAATGGERRAPRMTFTGAIGAICMFPLRAIIAACVALRIHPNTLTLIGVIINVGAAWALGFRRFVLAGVIMVVANIFDFIDGKVAHELHL